MANKSKANTNSSNVTKLHDGLVELDRTLKALVDAINDVSIEINDLQPILTNNNTVKESKPSPVKSRAKPVKKKVVKKPTATKSKPKSPSEMFLETINTSSIDEIIEKLKQVGTRQNVIKNILNERKKDDFQTFTSLDDVVTRIKGLAKPSLDKIIEQWS
jgi:seryl-tRNA synthetase